MFLLLFIVLLLPALAASTPLDDEEGSTFMPLEIHHGRPHASFFDGTQRASALAFLNSPFVKRDNGGTFKPLYQGLMGMVPRRHMDEKAYQRKLVWQNTIKKGTTKKHPDQVLPIRHDALKRSRCNALPFIQNVFRKGCTSLQIPNKFCFGQCNSFYVPGLLLGLPEPCTSCAPARSRHISVPLLCRGGRLSWEQVVLVEECDCGTRYDDSSRSGSGEGHISIS